MRGKSSSEHYSDEALLAHLDGELIQKEDAEVAAHLKACWLCRATLAELEEQALLLAKAAEADVFPGPDRTAEAKHKLLVWQAAFERQARSWPRLVEFRGSALGRLAWGAGLAGCLAAAIWVTQPLATNRNVPAPAPARLRYPAPPRMEKWEPLPQPPRIHPSKGAPPAALFAVPAEPVNIRLLEVEAHYALHKVGACMGMPVEVARDAAGCVVIRGLVNSTGQKDRLHAAFAQINVPGCLRLEVKTIAEAVAERPAGESEAGTGGGAVRVVGDKLPLQEQLEGYFAASREAAAGSQTASARSMVADFANEAVAQADALLAEAWALRRLAELYGDEDLEQMPAPAGWLLEVMIQDHLKALRDRSGAMRSLLGPPLAAITSDTVIPKTAGHAGPDDPAWDVTLLRVFRSAQQLRGSVFAVFTGAGLPANDLPQPAVASAAELLGRLRQAEDEVNMAAQALGSDRSDRPAVATHRKPPE